jgi:hypothetical protein
MFPVYVVKFLSHEVVHNWVEEFSQGRSKVTDDARQVRKWLRQQSKDCGFRRTGKAKGQVYRRLLSLVECDAVWSKMK